MAENTIIIEFVPCEPAPVNGYLVKYRPFGSLIDYRVVTPNQTESPIVIVDENDPPGTSYEGTIQGDCGGGIYGPASPWEFGNDQNSGSGSVSFGPVVCPYHIVVMTENLGFNATSCENIKYWVKLVDDDGNPVLNPLGVNIKVNATASYLVGDCATPTSSFTVTGDLEIAPGQSESFNFFAATAPDNIVADLELNSVDPAVLNDCEILLPSPGVRIDDARLSNVLETHCAQPTSTIYTDDGTIAPGKTLYNDAALSVVITGFDFVSKESVGVVYNVNDLTGVVGSNTGESC